VKIIPDNDICGAHGACAMVDEELFNLDDDGFISIGDGAETFAGSGSNNIATVFGENSTARAFGGNFNQARVVGNNSFASATGNSQTATVVGDNQTVGGGFAAQ